MLHDNQRQHLGSIRLEYLRSIHIGIKAPRVLLWNQQPLTLHDASGIFPDTALSCDRGKPNLFLGTVTLKRAHGHQRHAKAAVEGNREKASIPQTTIRVPQKHQQADSFLSWQWRSHARLTGFESLWRCFRLQNRTTRPCHDAQTNAMGLMGIPTLRVMYVVVSPGHTADSSS